MNHAQLTWNVVRIRLFLPGPGFFVCFLAVSTPEVSWDQLSWAQVYRFLFFCFCVSWAHREQAHEMTGDREQTGKVSHVTLSKAELCNNGPYLDARTDRISPHTSLLPSTPSRIPQKILFQGFLRVEARSPLTNLPWYADRLLRVIIVCFVTSYTQRPLRRLHSRKLCK